MAADITVTSQITQHGTQFEKKHVQHVYDEIATSMNELRHKAWPNVKRFLKNFPPSSLIADIGCGNGRYLSINKSTYKIGLDVCTALVDDARNKGHEVSYGDNLQIPFRDNCFDGVVSIGVIHHFCSNERRISATKELARILRPGGRMMLYVWAYEQNHRKFESQDVLIPWHGLNKGRQQRLGSASSIQSYGQSSTSSVSEDEFTDKSIDTNTSNTSSPTAVRRQNSLSADDLTALQDLSDFKPSYYSLDFNGSPHNAKKMADNDTKYVWNKNGAKLYHSSSGTNKLISECRKLEASLRAMSAGNLEDLEKDVKMTLEIADDTDHYNNVNFAKNLTEDFNTDDIIEHPLQQSDVEITLDWNVGMLENDDFETAIPNVTSLSESCSQDRSENSNDDLKYNNNNSMKNMHQDSFDSGHESLKTSFSQMKFNPFLKDFSSSFEEVECFNFSPDIPKNFDNFPDANVEFKLPGKKNIVNNKKSEISFFGAVKSKLLELFDDDSKKMSQTSVRKSNPGTCRKNSNISNSIGQKTFNRQLKSELSMEQLDLAAKLNFRVREFPLSSCPDVVSDGQSSHGSDQSGSSIHLSHCESANQCSCNSLSKEYCEHCKSTFKCTPMISNHAKDIIIEEKCQNEEENGVLQHIYDGYFKIEVNHTNDRKEQPNYLDSQKGALNSNLNVKNGCSVSQNTKDSLKMSKENNMSKCLQNDNSVFTKQCNINVNNSQVGAYSSPNGRPVETGQFSIDKNNKIHNNSEDTTSIKKSQSKEDDSVFDNTDDSYTSKLCRYYHVFREGEVENMISTHITDLQIIQCIYDHGNWCVIAEKL